MIAKLKTRNLRSAIRNAGFAFRSLTGRRQHYAFEGSRLDADIGTTVIGPSYHLDLLYHGE